MSAVGPDYYELLQIGRDAPLAEIIRAYRNARMAYQDGALATYALMDEATRERMLARIDEAYHVLSNPELKRAYDAWLDAGCPTRDPFAAAANEEPDASSPETPVPWTGRWLRHQRRRAGLSLAALAERTRISRSYLEAIEAEDTARLPERPYLRGYLRQYAQEIHVDPEPLLARYPPLAKTDRDKPPEAR